MVFGLFPVLMERTQMSSRAIPEFIAVVTAAKVGLFANVPPST